MCRAIRTAIMRFGPKWFNSEKLNKRIILCGLGSCFFRLAGNPSPGEPDGYPKTIIDIANRSVILDEPAERIVLLHEYVVEPIYLLGEGDRVVGVTTATKNQMYPWLEGMDEKSEVGTYSEHNYEQIIQLKPDVVITLPRYIEEDAAMLEDKGIKVIALGFEKPIEFEKEFTALSEIVDREEKAKEFLTWRQEQLDLIQDRTTDLKADDRKKVYCEWSDWPLHTGSKDTGKDALITLAGGTNIASNLSIPHPEVSPEWILAENPDAILFSSSATFAESNTGRSFPLRTSSVFSSNCTFFTYLAAP